MLAVVLFLTLFTPPTLLTQGGTGRAVSVESPTYTIEPFKSDRFIVFSTLSDSHELSAAGELNSTVYLFTVEHVEPVPECPSISYVFLKAPELPNDPGDLHVWITSHGLSSNRVRVGFGHLGGGSPDTDCRPTFVVFDGNSLTSGESASSFEYFYPTQTMNEIGCAWEFVNLGLGGIPTADMVKRAPTAVDPLLRAGVTSIVVAWEGTNSMATPGGHLSAEAAYAQMREYCLARRAAGWKVIVLPVLPRSGLFIFPDFESRRQTYNSLIRSHWPEFADGFADVASDPKIGCAGCDLSAYYDTDHIHLKDAGYTVVAGYVKASILALH